MSLMGIFDIGRSAILAHQTALNVTAHNIANVNTPGYSKQEAVLEIATPDSMQIGRGVNVSTIISRYDVLTNTQLLAQTQTYGSAKTLADGYGAVEQVFNEAIDIGLSGDLQEFFNSWHEVANNPEGFAQRTVLMQKAEDLVLTAQRMEHSMEELINASNTEISDAVGRINILADEIAVLNSKIGMLEGGGGSANDLKDMRERKLGELSELIGFSIYEGENNMYTVIVGQQNLVEGDVSTNLQWDPNAKTVMMSGIDISGKITKGRVGGLLELRETIDTELLTPLRQLVSDLIKSVNDQHRLGYGLDGVSGRDFFGPDVDDPGFVLADVIKNFSVSITDPNEIAAAGTNAGPGDNANALAIAQLSTSTSVMQDYKALVTTAGTLSSGAVESFKFEENLLSNIRERRDMISSVSLDEEAANLIKFQRGFQAGARMISVTDELMKSILAMV